MNRFRLLATTTATALLASSAMAVAADAPKLDGAPQLVRISGGAQLHYDLRKAASDQRVTIAGTTAKVKRFDEDGDRVYIATVNKGGLKAGKSYRVVVKVGSTKLLDRTMVLKSRHS